MNITDFKKYKNQKGSTMVLVLVVMSVLIIIGTVLSTLSLSTLKLTYYTAFQNNAYYANDGLVQEVMFRLDNFTYGAELDAYNHVMNRSYDSGKGDWDIYREALASAVEAGSLTEAQVIAMIQRVAELEYQKAYFESLTGNPILSDNYNLYTIVNNNLQLESLGNYELQLMPGNNQTLRNDFVTNLQAPTAIVDISNPTITINSTTMSLDAEDNWQMEVDLTTSADNNGVIKNMVFGAELKPPALNYVVQTDSSRDFVMNDIVNFGIATEGNIICTANNVEINGDVYAYGEYPDSERFDLRQMGGVLVGYGYPTSGVDPLLLSTNYHLQSNLNYFSVLRDLYLSKNSNLIVNGTLASHSAIKTMRNDSSILVTESTYSDFLMIDEESDKTININDPMIDVSDNIYTYQDVLLAGNNGKIEAGDSIFCFFHGDPHGNIDDRSGSIIINPYSDKDNTGEGVTANRVLISGKTYLKSYKDTDDFYMTSESISSGKYSWFYSTNLVDDSSSLFSSDQIEFNIYKELDRNNAGIINNKELIDSTSNYTDDEDQFKFEKFMEVYDYGSSDPSIASTMKQDDKDKVQINTIKNNNMAMNYTEGLIVVDRNDPADSNVLWDTSLFTSLPPGSTNGAVTFETKLNFDNTKNLASEDIDSATNVLGRRRYDTNADELTLFDRYINATTVRDQITEDQFDNFVFYSDKVDEHLFINAPNNDLVSAINTNSDVLIRNNDGSNVESLTGVIVTRNDVFIYAGPGETVEINGTIISKGNVYLYGEGSIRINFDERQIYRIIAQDSGLMTLFNSNTGVVYKAETPNTYVFNGDFVPEVRVPTSAEIAVGGVYENRNISVQTSIPNLADLIKIEGTRSYDITKWHEQ